MIGITEAAVKEVRRIIDEQQLPRRPVLQGGTDRLSERTGRLLLVEQGHEAQAGRHGDGLDGDPHVGGTEPHQLRDLGMSGLPYFIVLGKDRKVLFSLTMNPRGRIDRDILYDVLEKAGVSRIHPVGEPFDPQLHEAMAMVENPDAEPNSVCCSRTLRSLSVPRGSTKLSSIRPGPSPAAQ